MNLQAVMSRVFPSITHSYTSRDSILYALGLGYGIDPLNRAHLPFVYEKEQRTVPSYCVVLGYPGFWAADPALEIDWVRLLHGEHFFEIHRPIPPEGVARSEHRIVAVDDRGVGSPAHLFVEKQLFDSDNKLSATIRQTLVLRGDGGCGSAGSPPPAQPALPDGPPDSMLDIPTSAGQALLYRLNGDYNPIHADPDVAAKAGFDRPILHGLCSMGIACRAVLEAYCDNDGGRLRSMFVRFSKPVFPGETLRFEFYRDGPLVGFRARALDRNAVVLDRCSGTLSA
ncbi:MAG: MaoC/PaaZ C-terminal domain-containing protein [Sphingobium sp.]